MPANRTFVKIRRTILEHIETRNLTPYEFAALMVIILSADKANGVWWGSDKALSGKFGYAYPEKTAKTVLRSLRDKGYLKMFRNPGETGNAPYLVNRYEITVGDLSGGLINAEATTDWQHPVICHAPDDVPAHVLEDVPAHVPLSIPTKPTRPDTSKPQELKSKSGESARKIKTFVVDGRAYTPNEWPQFAQKRIQFSSIVARVTFEDGNTDIGMIRPDGAGWGNVLKSRNGEVWL